MIYITTRSQAKFIESEYFRCVQYDNNIMIDNERHRIGTFYNCLSFHNILLLKSSYRIDNL